MKSISSFENTIQFTQNQLDCTDHIQTNDSPVPVSVISTPYVFKGPNLNLDHTYFFKNTLVTDCQLLDCFYHNDCSTLPSLFTPDTMIQPDNSGTSSPFILTYQQDFKDGFGPISLCIECRSTNDYLDTFTFSIQQTALNCDPSLVPKIASLM